MLRKYFVKKLQQGSRNFTANYCKTDMFEHLQADYENSVKALNGLQSNAQYIKIAQKEKLSHDEEHSKTILQIQKYLLRLGITLETLDTLPVIHVAGTKGKGSTCALCESILRHHGLRTGFYSSPHLLEVRERIRINGIPLERQQFAEHFWHVYNKLDKEKTDPDDMPMYFKFLTILAFRVFLIEKVDVAIIEVGIGGEYDSTNVLRNVPVAGITSLGLDHTSILGDSIKKIAWHKAGIMKSGSQVFTVPQLAAAMEVLEDRSRERNCSLTVVEPIQNLLVTNANHCPTEIFHMNASLAIALAQAWMNIRDKNCNITDVSTSAVTKASLSKCIWPGRYQILRSASNTYYLDGAHTSESIQVCAQWFIEATNKSPNKKALIFNATGDRNSEDLLGKLWPCSFEKVFFVPNRGASSNTADNMNLNIPNDQQLARCYTHCSLWLELQCNSNTHPVAKLVKALPSVKDALYECDESKYDVLITGSLHLVGAALSVLDPDLHNSNKSAV